MNKFKYFLFISIVSFSSFTHSIQNDLVKEKTSKIEALKSKSKKVWKWIKNNPKKTIAALTSAAAVATGFGAMYRAGYQDIRKLRGHSWTAFKHAPIFGFRKLVFKLASYVRDVDEDVYNNFVKWDPFLPTAGKMKKWWYKWMLPTQEYFLMPSPQFKPNFQEANILQEGNKLYFSQGNKRKTLTNFMGTVRGWGYIIKTVNKDDEHSDN